MSTLTANPQTAFGSAGILLVIGAAALAAMTRSVILSAAGAAPA